MAFQWMCEVCVEGGKREVRDQTGRTVRDSEEEPQKKWEHQNRHASDFANPHREQTACVPEEGLMFLLIG